MTNVRNHNGLSNRRQDPAAWSVPAQLAMKSALEDRYLLLPYLYTLMYNAHRHGDMVVSPLLANYPTDPETWEIDEQLMWGDGILISPVLQQGANTVRPESINQDPRYLKILCIPKLLIFKVIIQN